MSLLWLADNGRRSVGPEPPDGTLTRPADFVGLRLAPSFIAARVPPLCQQTAGWSIVGRVSNFNLARQKTETLAD